MTKEQFDQLVEQFGKDAAVKFDKLATELEKKLADKYKEMTTGAITKEEFEAFKKAELSDLNTRLEEAEKLSKVVEKQGELINELKLANEKNNKGEGITLDSYLEKLMPEIKKLRAAGAGFMEVTSKQLKEAGVVSFGGMQTKVPASHTVGGTSIGPVVGGPIAQPYIPGLGGSDLELFDIVRNPNFITNRVDVGRTNQSRLAWINETAQDGVALGDVPEAGNKPQIQYKFNVEFSTAKKAAAHVVISEEFEDDIPGLATAIRRMLQNDVMLAFETAIQDAVIAAARPYEIVGLDDKVEFVTLFDAMGALLAQVGFYNFTPNTLALNPVTSWESLMAKNAEGDYLNPPFMDRINRILVEANKVAVGFGLAGDLSQFKVDIYKDFTLRIGWINEQFIQNVFSVVGEMRYHAYISENRKKAIVYDSLADVMAQIEAPVV